MSQPSDNQNREAIFTGLREELDEAFDEAIEQHEAKMTKLGFVFLGVFVGVIVLAALLP